MLADLLLAALLFTPQECPPLVEKAAAAYQARKFDVAAEAFSTAILFCPNPAALLLGLGQSQLMLQKPVEAVATFDRVLAIDPKSLQALKLKGDALYIGGDEPAAEKVLLSAREIDPRNEPVLYALGRIYYQQSRYTEAVPLFLRIIERDPEHYRAHDNLALCYEALHQDEQALREYLRTLDLVHQKHPDYDWVYGNLANFFLRRDQNEKAFQAGAEAAKRNPNSARNFFLTGKALYKLDKYPQSVRWLEQAAKLDPAYPEARYLLAQVYRKQGRTADADRELLVFRELSQKPRPRK